MSGNIADIWVYLAATPLTGLTTTLGAYVLGRWLFRRSGHFPLLNPVLLAVVTLVGLLYLTGVDYHTYFEGAQFVHFLLGPATVALAVPLYRQFTHVRRSALSLGVALVAGSLTAVATAMLIGKVMGASREVIISLAPKSVTTPIAMGIAELTGGLPSLTAVLVILTGILGASIGTSVLRIIGVVDPRATGFAMGVASHGIGTARALELGEAEGAFAGLAMGLNGMLTAIALPLILAWLGFTQSG
jgi:predicted murein hydrolase (TIGR00659 family)